MINPTDPNLYQQASRWVLKLRDASCSVAEKHAFKAWLAADPRHPAAYRQAESVWQSFDAAERQAAGPQLANARAQFRNVQKQARQSRTKLLARLAMAGLVLVAAPLTWQWLNSAEYHTSKGQRLQLTLRDGSQIELNTDTRLRINYAWQTRKVTLESGEALFSVVHDPEKPFEVIADSGRIRDIGTRFNVSRWLEATTVSVLEGEVEVSTASSTLSERLQPGRQISFDRRGSLAAQAKFDADAVTAWQRDLLMFNKTPLSDVLNQLSRYHDVELRLADPSLRDLKVSGDFPSKDLSAALNVITAALPLKAVPQVPGVILLKR